MPDTLTQANLVGKLDVNYYNDPSKLGNAPYAGMPPAVLTVTGNKLSIRSPANWVGTYIVEATASDGHFAVKRSFTVTVGSTPVNSPPVLAAIANQTMPHSQDALTLTLSATDMNNDPLTYSAQVLPVNGAMPAVTVSVVGKQLTINPAASFVGTFLVQVNVSDGTASDAKTFSVTVTNNAVTLGAIAPQTMATNQTSLTVALPASDADGDALSFQAAVQSSSAQAYQLNQQYSFMPTNATYYQNLYGFNEKWLTSKNNLWYMLLPDGKIYRWNLSIAQTMTAANLIATVDPKIYAEPRLLWNAAAPVTPAIAFSFSGNQMTIQRPASLTGIFFVEVTVSDGVATAKRTFQITLN